MTAADVERVLGEAGAVEHSAVDSCTSEHRDRDGQWHTCTEPGDHEDDHQNDYAGSWPWDDVDDPRQVRRRWVEVPLSMSDLAAVIAPLLDQARAQGGRQTLVDAAESWIDEGTGVMFNKAKVDLSPQGRVRKWLLDLALNTKENDHG